MSQREGRPLTARIDALARVLLGAAALVVGCTPTLSAPRGDVHLEALGRGERHHHHGRMSEAAEAFAEAARGAERRVDRDEAQYRQAKALERLGRTDEALAVYDAVGARAPLSRRTMRARYDAARLRIGTGDVVRGEAALVALVEEAPDSGVASSALRELAERWRETEGARLVAWVDRLVERHAETELGDDLAMLQGELRLEAADLPGARASFARVMAEHPYPFGARFDDAAMRLADVAEQQGDLDGALEALERLVAVFEPTRSPGSYTPPKLPMAALRVARIHRGRGALEEAARAYARVRDDFATSRLRDDAFVEEGEMWLAAGARERGCALLREAIETYEVGAARRRALARSGECEEASRR